MAKIIRLTENDLEKIVKRIIKESDDSGLVNKIRSLTPIKSKSKSNRIKYYNAAAQLVAINHKNQLMISGHYFLKDLGWTPTIWNISRPNEKALLDQFKEVWNQVMNQSVGVVRIFDNDPDMTPDKMKGEMIKSDIDTTSNYFDSLDFDI